MTTDVLALQRFYTSDLGKAAQASIATRLHDLWGEAKGLRVLGYGYAAPFLETSCREAERVVCLMPARQGVVHWPQNGKGRVFLSEEVHWPAPDASFDRVLIAHGLEDSEAIAPLLREAWRVLTGEGRLMVIVPNRRGLWALSDATPFGSGRSFTRGQLQSMLTNAMYAPTAWAGALHMPPVRARFMIRASRAWETVGAQVWPGACGALMAEAEKHVYATPAKRAPAAVFAPRPQTAWPARAQNGCKAARDG